jgi:hypothetical protein
LRNSVELNPVVGNKDIPADCDTIVDNILVEYKVSVDTMKNYYHLQTLSYSALHSEKYNDCIIKKIIIINLYTNTKLELSIENWDLNMRTRLLLHLSNKIEFEPRYSRCVYNNLDEITKADREKLLEIIKRYLSADIDDDFLKYVDEKYITGEIKELIVTNYLNKLNAEEIIANLKDLNYKKDISGLNSCWLKIRDIKDDKEFIKYLYNIFEIININDLYKKNSTNADDGLDVIYKLYNNKKIIEKFIKYL